MPLAAHSTRARIDNIAFLGGCLILIDFVWGAVAVYPLDWTRAADVVLGTSFLIGLPAYVFDFWRKGRIPISLAVVFLVRVYAEYFAGSPPTFGRSWTGTALLAAAAVLLQLSKLRNEGLTGPAD